MSISLTVNGQSVQVPEGSTVLDAVNDASTYLSQLCKDPDMKAIGACRTCLVQVEGMRGFPASCSVPASDGLVVRTDTPEVERIRSGVLELTLAMLPSDAPVRPAVPSPIRGEGEYGQLTRAAQHYGIDGSRWRSRPREETDASNPVFSIGMESCILCARCVNACQEEHQFIGAIDFLGAGAWRPHRHIYGQAPGRVHLHHLRPVPVRLSHRRHPGQGHHRPVDPLGYSTGGRATSRER